MDERGFARFIFNKCLGEISYDATNTSSINRIVMMGWPSFTLKDGLYFESVWNIGKLL